MYDHCGVHFSQFVYFFDRVQKNFEGKLIGADRAKDLAVLKVFIFLQTLPIFRANM